MVLSSRLEECGIYTTPAQSVSKISHRCGKMDDPRWVQKGSSVSAFLVCCSMVHPSFVAYSFERNVSRSRQPLFPHEGSLRVDGVRLKVRNEIHKHVGKHFAAGDPPVGRFRLHLLESILLCAQLCRAPRGRVGRAPTSADPILMRNYATHRSLPA